MHNTALECTVKILIARQCLNSSCEYIKFYKWKTAWEGRLRLIREF